MSIPTTGIPPVLQNPDPQDAYKELYDSLDDAYWEASDMSSKDLVHGVQQQIGDILDSLVQQQLSTNTAAFAAIGAQITAANTGLKKIQASIDQITKNIATAAKVVEGITKVLALFPWSRIIWNGCGAGVGLGLQRCG